jgi:hypothetical protein
VLDALERHEEPVAVEVLVRGERARRAGASAQAAELRAQWLAIRSGKGVKRDPYLWMATDVAIDEAFPEEDDEP